MVCDRHSYRFVIELKSRHNDSKPQSAMALLSFTDARFCGEEDIVEGT